MCIILSDHLREVHTYTSRVFFSVIFFFILCHNSSCLDNYCTKLILNCCWFFLPLLLIFFKTSQNEVHDFKYYNANFLQLSQHFFFFLKKIYSQQHHTKTTTLQFHSIPFITVLLHSISFAYNNQVTYFLIEVKFHRQQIPVNETFQNSIFFFNQKDITNFYFIRSFICSF